MSETIKILNIFRHSGRYLDIYGHIRNKSRQKKKKKIKSGRFCLNRPEIHLATLHTGRFKTVQKKPFEIDSKRFFGISGRFKTA
jgi:hypothetical protein